jgi:Mg-chelatase subunit ChlD
VLTLAAPWWLLFALLPLLLRWLLPPFRPAHAGVVVPFLDRIVHLTGQQAETSSAIARPPIIQQCILWACWLLMVLSLARPQYLEPPISRTIPTRDLLLAVDLSGSMETKDFTNEKGQRVDRLTAVKEVLDDFLKRRKGDRVGLIFFGSAAFVQAPFTEDLDACRSLLDEAQVRMAGPKTAFGDAIGLAMTVFEHEPAVNDRVLIALTDGNDTGSDVPPARAAQIAHDRHITIHTIAVGDPKAAGEEKLDEQALKDVASATGGMYSHASDRASLAKIYDELDAIRTRPVETVTHRPRRDLFFWPLGAAIILTLLYHAAWALRSHAFHQLPSAATVTKAAAAIGAALSLGAVSDFHFLRPWWLLAILPAAGLVALMARNADSLRAWRRAIDPSLLKYLTVGSDEQRRWRPVTALAIVSLLAILAAAGPTWRREPAPFTDDESVLAVILKVTPSMTAKDVQPSRLARAAQKIGDVLKERRGTRTALIAYAGSAHVVLPFTRDDELVAKFAADLKPEIMPKEGDRPDEALQAAQQLIEKANAPASVLLVTDSLPDDVAPALEAYRKADGAPVQILAVAANADVPIPADSPPAPSLDLAALNKAASPLDASITTVTADDSDIQSIASHTVSRLTSAAQETPGQRWLDAGYWLAFIAAAAMLSWFRAGWFITWPTEAA